MIGVLFLLALVIIASAVVEIVRRHRRMKQRALLGALAATLDRGVPLVQTLDAYASETSGGFGADVAQFSHILKEGATVPDALAFAPKVFPDDALPLLLVGFATGTPGQALRRSMESFESRPPVEAVAGRLTYLALFVSTATAILTFLCVKIAPAFEKIFIEFGQTLPPVTLGFLEVIKQSLTGVIAFWILVFLLLFVVYCALRYYGVIAWDLPGVRRLTRRPHAAAVLDGLALALENRQPLPPCVQSLARQYPRSSVRNQLNWIAGDLEAGMTCWDSLYRRELIGQADRTLLEAAHRAGNLAWALAEVADNQRRRWLNQLHYAVNLLYPALVLMMGALVLWVMLAFFTPLVSLIKSLSGGH